MWSKGRAGEGATRRAQVEALGVDIVLGSTLRVSVLRDGHAPRTLAATQVRPEGCPLAPKGCREGRGAAVLVQMWPHARGCDSSGR